MSFIKLSDPSAEYDFRDDNQTSTSFGMTNRGIVIKYFCNKYMRKEYKFYVYILTNYTKSVFYVGFTNDLIRRIIEYKNGFGSKFTKRYKLEYLIHYEETANVLSAIGREKEIKGWKREKKLDLVKNDNANLDDLSGKLFRDAGIGELEMQGIVNELKNRYARL